MISVLVPILSALLLSGPVATAADPGTSPATTCRQLPGQAGSYVCATDSGARLYGPVIAANIYGPAVPTPVAPTPVAPGPTAKAYGPAVPPATTPPQVAAAPTTVAPGMASTVTTGNVAGPSVTLPDVPVTVAPPPAAPAAGSLPLYVDPDTPAAQQERQWLAEGRTADAQRIAAIADQPQPLWVGGDGDVTATVSAYVAKAKAANARPLLVGYDIPDRDCGSFSGGGASGPAAYRGWALEFASALRGSSAVVVLEPDAIAHQLSGCAGQSDERYALLSDATAALSAAGATVYIDAGNPDFTGDVAATADALRRSGIANAAGFSLNVSNFIPTQDNIAYGTKISQALGGAHFVVDTSRNGAASEPASTGGAPSWCNPPGRLLGAAPTVDTGNPLVDALLWVKRPGESDGACRSTDPAAGQWFSSYALSLVGG